MFDFQLSRLSASTHHFMPWRSHVPSGLLLATPRPRPLQWLMSLCRCVTCSSRGARLCEWLPVGCENSGAIKQVMANIFQIKFSCNTLSLRRALTRHDRRWTSGLSSVKKKSLNPTFNQRECVHPLGRASAEAPDGWRRWHSAPPDPGEPRSRASLEHWGPVMGHNELLQI